MISVQFSTSHLLKLASTLTSVVIFLYRFYSQTVFMAQVAKFLILTTSVVSFVKHRNTTKTLLITWLLWSALLMRPHNVLLLPLCVITSQTLFHLCSSIEVLTLMHIWLEEILYYSQVCIFHKYVVISTNIFFFCQGFDNNFSSVDISPGYVGLQEYSLLYTSFQVICHTYIFRILPLLLLFKSDKCYQDKLKMLRIFMIYRLTSFTFYCFVILVHRHHIFIWSVFSPKLLIESCHGLCLFLIVLLILMFCKKEKERNIY